MDPRGDQCIVMLRYRIHLMEKERERLLPVGTLSVPKTKGVKSSQSIQMPGKALILRRP